MEAWASGLGSPEALKPAADGDELQQRLAAIAGRAAGKEFLYTKFFAIGLFRLLELTGAKDPKALEALVRAVGAPPDSVNRDLMTYKARPRKSLRHQQWTQRRASACVRLGAASFPCLASVCARCAGGCHRP